MKIAPTIAMFLVATDCFAKATGNAPQVLFSENTVWLWWVVGTFWAITTIAFLFEKP